MRQITRDAVNAFMNDLPFSKSNTTVRKGVFQTQLFLFGNMIAVKKGNEVMITNCGYFTATTKERLNAIPGVHICQKKGVWYLNGKEWDGKKTAIFLH